QAAAGTLYYPLEFTNTSRRTCTLDGYPRVALTTRMAPSSQVGFAARRDAEKPALVITLAPAATASATIWMEDTSFYTGSSISMCDPVSVSYLQVYPPGQTSAAYLPYTGQGCSKGVHLGAMTVQAGSGG
ncbi:MAG TPA: DUF4232 domain-containing protein, partial [Chloroflexota bacterium]|nr:DUF4232 domain-containing protein [Chloroflexota bacterium]